MLCVSSVIFISEKRATHLLLLAKWTSYEKSCSMLHYRFVFVNIAYVPYINVGVARVGTFGRKKRIRCPLLRM